MYFQHSKDIWSEYPELVAGVVAATGITGDRPTPTRVAAFTATAEVRLASGPAAEFPEIQAWRRVFARMGLKPTQYRCASEALLRRFTKERSLPPIHPLVDLCNAISLAHAIPVAAIDVAKVSGDLEVRHAKGDETYEAFSGAIEQPDRGEVSFVDSGGRAHARRWTNRQSGYSAVQDTTSTVLIVAEAMHASAGSDIPALIATLAHELSGVWSVAPTTAVLTESSPRFECPG